MDRIPDFAEWQELVAAFTAWWLGGGDKSRSAAFNLAATIATETMQTASGSYDLDDLVEKLDLYLQQKGHLTDWMPAANDFLHQAQALTIDACAVGLDGKKRNWSEQKMLVEGKCHGFIRVAEALKRLSDTLELRVDALRTVIATERERMRGEMNQPKQR